MHTLNSKEHEVEAEVRYRLPTIKCCQVDSLPADTDVKNQLSTVDRNIVYQRHSGAT